MSDSAILALEQAVKFESDGRDYYTRLAEKMTHPFSRLLFSALAKDEVDHIRRVREIYEELKDKPGWPSVQDMVSKASGVLDVFEKESVSGVDADANARDAFAKALEMEEKGLAFYQERLEKATCDAEATFFKLLIAEEQNHKKALEKALAEFE